MDVSTLLVSASSIIFGIVYLFGNMGRQIFDSLVFLFIVHPFNVGDIVMFDVDGTGKTRYTVRRDPVWVWANDS